MPSYRAIVSGNWSATSTWNVWSGTAWVAATVVPTTGDDVWSNNFTVTINQNVTVLTLRNTTTGAPGTGTVAGGGFVISATGFTLTHTSTSLATYVGTANLINVTGTSITTTLNIVTDWTANSGGGFVINVTSTSSTINLVGNQKVGRTGNNHGISFTGTNNTINYVGTIFIATYGTTIGGIIVAGTGNTFNHTGDITNNSLFNGSNLPLTLGVCTHTMIGNLYYASGYESNGNGGALITSTSATNSRITGNITGGANTVAVNFSGANTVINHIGILNGGNGGSGGTGASGIVCTGANSIAILSGPFIFGNYGSMPFNCARVFLSNNTSNYIEFASNSTGGALFPSPAPTRQTMYSPNTLADTPAQSNVRQGVVYALGSQTGTLIVPNPANVALGIGTDNTVGTAVLTPANVKDAVWDALLSDITTPDTIGVRLKNAATVDSTGDQIANLLNT